MRMSRPIGRSSSTTSTFLRTMRWACFLLVVNSVEKHPPLFSVHHIPILAYGLLVFRLVGFIRRERGSGW